MYNNKKANVDDPVEAILILLSFVFVFFIVWTVVTNFNDQVSTNDFVADSNETQEFITTYEGRFTSGFDFGFLFLIIVLPIFSFIAARLIPTRPVYMILFFFIVGFIILASFIASNMYGAMLESDKFALFAADLKFIPFIMPNLPYWVMLYLGLIVVALYTKSPS